MKDPHLIHSILHYMMSRWDNLPDKFHNFFDALAGQGLVSDSEIPDTLSKSQTKAIFLEYVERIYKDAGYGEN